MAETKIKKFNKMKVAVISLAVALVVAIGGMVGIYAASQQSVGANFTVSYNVGDNVAIAVGAVSSNSYIEDEYEWFSQSGSFSKNENGLFILNATEQNDNNLQLSYADVNMKPEDNMYTVMVRFYFENIGEGAIQASFTNNSDIKNMNTVYYMAPVVIPDDHEVQDIASIVHSPGSSDDEITLDENNSYSFQIEEGQIMCLMMPIWVNNTNKSAHFISEGDTGISFSFTKAESAE